MLKYLICIAAAVSAVAAVPKTTDCHPGGAGKSIVTLTNLRSVPYPPVFPGKIRLSYDITVKSPVANFDVNITMWKVFNDGIKVRVPCLGTGPWIGSCYYDDICGYLDDSFPDGCPILFPDCKCPFRSQKRSVRDLEVNLPEIPNEIAEVISGKLQLQIELRDSEVNESVLACSRVDLDIRT